MSMMPINPLGPEFSYVQVANDLVRRISMGEFTCRLPAERALAEEYEVAYATVRQAIGVLRERGLVLTRLGRGSYVAAVLA